MFRLVGTTPILTPPCPPSAGGIGTVVLLEDQTTPTADLDVDGPPHEILADIFALTLPEPQASEARGLFKFTVHIIPPRNIATVCRYWRDIVLTTRRLWTHCVLLWWESSPHSSVTRTAFRQCLALSGEQPMSMYISLMNHINVPKYVLNELNRMLIQPQRLWKRVTFDGDWTATLDVAQLGSSPLCEMSIPSNPIQLVGMTSGSILDRLSSLGLHTRNPSYLSLWN